MLISISGQKRTGKDLTASVIQWLLSGYDVPVESFINTTKAERNSYSTIKCVSFAHKIKVHCANVLGVSVEQMDNEEWRNKELGQEWEYQDGAYTPRQLMQKIGTDMARIIHPDYWVNALFIDYSSTKDWIITDTRFYNEVKATEDNNGLVIRLERNTGLTDDHVSEHALDNHKFKNVIDNNGTIDDLVVAIRKILIEHNFEITK